MMQAAPRATVDAWLAASPPLPPLRLLPALLRQVCGNLLGVCQPDSGVW
jgi:hypothetical protein